MADALTQGNKDSNLARAEVSLLEAMIEMIFDKYSESNQKKYAEAIAGIVPHMRNESVESVTRECNENLKKIEDRDFRYWQRLEDHCRKHNRLDLVERLLARAKELEIGKGVWVLE